jgi:hypothetical protein
VKKRLTDFDGITQILRRLVRMGAAARMGFRSLKKLGATPAECHKLWHSLRQFRHFTLFVSSALGAAATMLRTIGTTGAFV